MSETLRKYGAKFNRTFCTFTGLSTDTKPMGVYEGVNIANGSEFIEMDTDKKYLYDADSQTWKLAASGGGGGGGSATLIEKTITENGTYNASDDGADGYSSVTVEVPSAPTPETFDVTLTMDTQAGTAASSKTFAETFAAYNNGDILNLTVTADGTTVRTVCYGLYSNERMIVIVDAGTLSDPFPVAILWSSGEGQVIPGGDIGVIIVVT